MSFITRRSQICFIYDKNYSLFAVLMYVFSCVFSSYDNNANDELEALRTEIAELKSATDSITIAQIEFTLKKQRKNLLKSDLSQTTTSGGL